jgi:hypothetical protein
MLKLYSGEQVETNVKYKDHIPINKVPIIILNNRFMLKNEERWNTRIYRYIAKQSRYSPWRRLRGEEV